MAHHYPEPTSWEAFENLCCDLFRELWDAPTAMKHGRNGQPQAGVDVFGLPSGSASWFGVQCKKTLDAPLTREVLMAEVEKARSFNPVLSHFIVATTAKRDQRVQGWARELTQKVPFEVTVFAWEDICEAVAHRHELIRRHFGSVLPPVDPDLATADAAQAVDAFRRLHWSELLPLPSLAQARGQRRVDLLLTEIYTALDVRATIRVMKPGAGTEGPSVEMQARGTNLPGEQSYLDALVGAEQARLSAAEHGPKQRKRRCRAVEAAAANRRLVLVGAAGSGKSTFGRFLAACLLGESLGLPEADLSTLLGRSNAEDADDAVPDAVVWPHDAPLACFVSLQKFQASDAFPDADESGEAKHLIRYLEALGPESSRAAFARGLADALSRPDGALIILDGLDETPSAEASRLQLKRVIFGFVRAYSGCRVLVTSRPYAYKDGTKWRLDDAEFESIELAPFDQEQQASFVGAWYRRLVARNVLDVDTARRDALADDLIAAIRGTDYLSPLAESPLMLTMMADLHATNSGLPKGGRAALYEESVALLLDRWNELRDGTQPTEALDLTLEQIREALQELAFDVHRSRGVDDGRGTPEIRHSELWEALNAIRVAYGHEGRADDREIMNYLHQRSGILIGESATVYRFPHRSYQEYLAACYLVDRDDDITTLLDEVVTADPSLWREVVQLAVGRTSKQKSLAWAIVEMLVPESVPADDPLLDDPRFLRAVLAGLSIRETKLYQAPSAAVVPKVERVRRWLRRAVELGALDVQDRAAAGQVLGLLGDDRPGVGLGDDGLPDFEWVEILAGSFVMGGEEPFDAKPVHDEHVEAYRISRYPLTNAQYGPFVADGGYTERWRHCWTDAGWEWKGDRDGPEIERDPLGLSNHPRVSVCWFEVVAFCRWLSAKTGVTYRLPTGAEWERAARGVDGRAYPWGPEFDASLCNSGETGIGTTTAVGIFPGGESPPGENDVGLRDASGNVLEWCSTQYRDGYDEPAIDDLDGSAVRVLRGGSFADFNILARCAFRYWFDPGYINRNVGFRVVSPLNP